MAVAMTLCLLLLSRVAVAQQTPDPARFADEIRAFSALDQVEMPPPGGVLFVGSSSIRMWESLEEDFPAHRVVGRGFGGSHFSDLLHYADQIVFPYEPRMILVYEGDNDIASGRTPAHVYGDYREFVGRVRERLPETSVAFIAIKPSVARWDHIDAIRAANQLIEEHAAADSQLMYIDVATPMLGPDGQPREELFIDDGLHLSREGYDLWRDMVASYLD